MTITNERAEKLSQYLNADHERADALLAMPVEEACAKINADGYDFTTEELAEFAQGVSKVLNAQKGEINEEDLHDVAGGGAVRDIYDIFKEHCYWAQKKGSEWGRKIGKWLFG